MSVKIALPSLEGFKVFEGVLYLDLLTWNLALMTDEANCPLMSVIGLLTAEAEMPRECNQSIHSLHAFFKELMLPCTHNNRSLYFIGAAQ